MLEEIGDVSNDPASSSRKVKDKNDGVRLMGFGHRVYKNYDPRAKLMRETCHEVLEELGLEDDTLFKLAMALEKIALEDDYFVERKLYPNVDFYSGIVLRRWASRSACSPCIFALARTVGWIAQWNEMISRSGAEDRPAAPAVSPAPRSAMSCRSTKRKEAVQRRAARCGAWTFAQCTRRVRRPCRVA